MSKKQQQQDTTPTPLTPRTIETAKTETRIVLWFFFKWVFCPSITVVLWEHFANILRYEWKPTFFIDLFRTSVVAPFWRLFGGWTAYLSGFVELLKLNELYATIEKLMKSIGNLLLSVKEFFDGYTQIIKDYEWTLGSTIVGSVIIIALLVGIIYLFRERLRLRWVKLMEISRSCRTKLLSIIPYYGTKKNAIVVVVAPVSQSVST